MLGKSPQYNSIPIPGSVRKQLGSGFRFLAGSETGVRDEFFPFCAEFRPNQNSLKFSDMFVTVGEDTGRGAAAADSAGQAAGQLLPLRF